MDNKNLNKAYRRWVLRTILVVIVLAAIILYFKDILTGFNWLKTVFMPLILGCCIAFVLNMPMDWFERKVFTSKRFPGKKEKFRRPLALLTTILFFLLVIALVIGLVVPQLIRSIKLLIDSIPGAITALQSWFALISEKFPAVKSVMDSLTDSSEELESNILNYLKNGVGTTFNTAIGVTSTVFGSVVTFFIGLMFSMYILTAKVSLGRHFRELLYSMFDQKKAERILYVLHLTNDSFQAFISSQFLEALILFGMYVIVAFVFRLPYSMMIAVLIGVFSLIPLFGAYIAWGIASVLLVMVNPMDVVYFTAIFLIISQIEGNLIYPHIVGSSMGIPGIWVLAAVTVGGNMMGITGMIIAVPVASVLYTLLKLWKDAMLHKKQIPVSRYTKGPDWKEYDPEKDFYS